MLALRHLRPGVTQFIIHCGTDDPELQAVTNRYASRDFDRRVFIDPDLKAEVQKLGVCILSWKQLRNLHKHAPLAREANK